MLLVRSCTRSRSTFNKKHLDSSESLHALYPVMLECLRRCDFWAPWWQAFSTPSLGADAPDGSHLRHWLSVTCAQAIAQALASRGDGNRAAKYAKKREKLREKVSCR